ncbi:hypothetical protein AGABI2DRAFT_144540 [Agaricus bisporus var. bisporus H97]|uniref:hypothetical protein n=1 Tax=Agaricus bisporus var. bisporus (strain H97 / ATCC MYA-4626 / FGSC 10389) TaxID=936046 RepID=UPI00029F6C52|nr:hypothetical protein AGABI2DRAFT_144540 [Agaricus bisporus var. bisporus H97]EKV45014.1 hypothetical protein AGABI2DRAFT_144540 [Agaricus bisporus var. bisporus H97]
MSSPGMPSLEGEAKAGAGSVRGREVEPAGDRRERRPGKCRDGKWSENHEGIEKVEKRGKAHVASAIAQVHEDLGWSLLHLDQVYRKNERVKQGKGGGEEAGRSLHHHENLLGMALATASVNVNGGNAGIEAGGMKEEASRTVDEGKIIQMKRLSRPRECLELSTPVFLRFILKDVETLVANPRNVDVEETDMAQAVVPEAAELEQSPFPVHQVERKDERAKQGKERGKRKGR